MFKVISVQLLIFVLLLLIVMVSNISNSVWIKKEIGRMNFFTTLNNKNKEYHSKRSVEAALYEDDHLEGIHVNWLML